MERKLNHRLLTAIENNDIEKVRTCCQKLDSNFDDDYVDLAVKLGHVECLRILISENWPGVWSGTGLTQAVKHHRSDCVEILFDKSCTPGKYMAFHAAIEAKNIHFLSVFIPTIPRNSTNWFMVFDALMKAQYTDMVELALHSSNWMAILQKNAEKPQAKQYQNVFEELDAKRQKVMLLKNIDQPNGSNCARKM